jgi:hypothetical protein
VPLSGPGLHFSTGVHTHVASLRSSVDRPIPRIVAALALLPPNAPSVAITWRRTSSTIVIDTKAAGRPAGA